MAEFETHLLSLIVFLPLLFALGSLLILSQNVLGKRLLQGWTVLGTLVTFLFSILIYLKYDPKGADFQLTESVSWISSLGISYSVGVDGISLWLILLTTFLMPIAVLCSVSAIEERCKEY